MEVRKKGAMVGVVGLLAALAIVPVASAELAERGDLFVTFKGGIDPTSLPRRQLAPIAVSVEGTVKTLSGARPPALREIRIELNRGGVLDSHGLPLCRYRQLVAATPRRALRSCGPARVGGGAYRGSTAFPEQESFPSSGRIIAFNAVYHGHRAILAHVYGTEPVPITRVLVFHIRRGNGDFGTVLTGHLPDSLNHYGYLRRIRLSLFRVFTYRGRRHSYISAACDAPPGFGVASFPFARASMRFADGRRLSSTLTRSCHVSR